MTGPSGKGSLAWKPGGWVCDTENDAVVSNIPRFLPEPTEYRCECEGERLVDLVAGAL